MLNGKKLGVFMLILGHVAVSSLVHATNGYFQHGYGTKSKGMGGAGVAYPQDTLAAAANPAGMFYVGKRIDAGIDWFRPIRNTSIKGNLAPANNIDYNASEKKNFFIPEFGYNQGLGSKMSLGVVLIGNGGMNTAYTRNITLFGTSKAGIDLSQMFISPTWAMKVHDKHAVGVSLNFAVQRFKTTGLENFSAMPGLSASPGDVTNRGYDSSTGWGLRLGWLGKITPRIALGASYQTKMEMSEFKKYKGLFAEKGDFDIPANYSAGIAADVLPKVKMALDIGQIKYSGVKSVANPLLPNFAQAQLGSNNGAGFGWKDMTVIKLGVSYDYTDALTLRAGLNRAEQPIPDSETLFNMLAPAVVENHATLGATWKSSDSAEWSLAYMHAFEKDVNGKNSIPPSFGGGEANLRMYEDSLGITFGKRF